MQFLEQDVKALQEKGAIEHILPLTESLGLQPVFYRFEEEYCSHSINSQRSVSVPFQGTKVTVVDLKYVNIHINIAPILQFA